VPKTIIPRAAAAATSTAAPGRHDQPQVRQRPR
jgi:hypothetical protein